MSWVLIELHTGVESDIGQSYCILKQSAARGKGYWTASSLLSEILVGEEAPEGRVGRQ